MPLQVNTLDFFTWWDGISKEDVDDFVKALGTAKREDDLQQYLTNKPRLLIQSLRGGSGRWVIPKQRLGNLITDFVIGQKRSFGYDWVAVELERPKAQMFNKNGDPTATLTHAIR